MAPKLKINLDGDVTLDTGATLYTDILRPVPGTANPHIHAAHLVSCTTETNFYLGSDLVGRTPVYRIGTGAQPNLAVGIGSGDALPAASDVYRGELRIVRGGFATEDNLYCCLKDNAVPVGGYSWVLIATG